MNADIHLSRSKLVLSAIIQFIKDPDVRLAVAFLVSFISLEFVHTTRPFVSPSLDTLMVASLLTQTLTLACMLIPFQIMLHEILVLLLF